MGYDSTLGDADDSWADRPGAPGYLTPRKPQNEWQPPIGEPFDPDLERRIEDEEVFDGDNLVAYVGLPEPMTNDQIAEMIVCMTSDEELNDVIDRLVHWTAEEWSQCDVERNARKLTINDQYEIIGMVVVKSTQLT